MMIIGLYNTLPMQADLQQGNRWRLGMNKGKKTIKQARDRDRPNRVEPGQRHLMKRCKNYIWHKILASFQLNEGTDKTPGFAMKSPIFSLKKQKLQVYGCVNPTRRLTVVRRGANTGGALVVSVVVKSV